MNNNIHKYTLKVLEKISETKDTVTLKFKQPSLKKVNYSAGQYLTLIFKINGRRYIRPYSFSSAPGIDSTLDVTVKRVPNGIVSNHIVDMVEVGNVIEVLKPMGEFVLEKIPENIKNKHLILWGCGSGVTPLMSLAKYALYKQDFDHITLVYGNRNFESVIFKDQINFMEQQYASVFSVVHFHTQPVTSPDNPEVVIGRIDPELVLKVITEKSQLENTFHYICGPGELKHTIKKMLSFAGVGSGNIFSEDFEVIRNPKDFEDILTQNVTFVINNTTSVVEVSKGQSILEAGLDSMLDLTYSCQTGSCLLCKAKLLTGKIKTVGIDKIPSALHKNEHLLCCSFPISDNVEILIDN